MTTIHNAMLIQNEFIYNKDAGYESDEVTDADRARWAAAAAATRLPVAYRGGRDANGSLIEHATNCRGTCCVPEVKAKVTAFNFNSEKEGYSWGDVVEADRQATIAAETPDQTRARIQKQEAEDKAAMNRLIAQSIKEKKERWHGNRMAKPCDYQALFINRVCSNCLSHVPVGQTHCQAKAQPWSKATERRDLVRQAAKRALANQPALARPASHMTCGQELSGCWNHADSRSCAYVHPDEGDLWAAAVSGKLCYDRQAQSFYLKGQEPVQNRFAAMSGRANGGWEQAGNKRARNNK